MFSLYDIVTAGIMLLVLFSLFILFQMEKSISKPRIYLRTALGLVLIILILEELVFLKQYSFIVWIYPILFFAYFSIYPLIYLYSRDLVFNGKDNNRPRLIVLLAYPIIAFVFVAVIYYQLNYNSKIEFMRYLLVELNPKLKTYTVFQYVIFPAYYLQVIFYIISLLKLISIIKKNIYSNPWELLLARYILFTVIAFVLYESLLIIFDITLYQNFILLITVEQLLTLTFILFQLYICFKQSLIVIQSRINKYSEKLEARNYSEQNKSLLLENEKIDIKEAIENYFADSKVYLDPNLKIEVLSKRMHIPARKISIVINEIYETNFHNFINHYRVLEAKKIIKQNPHDIKIENIFLKAGFNSRSSFNRVFKLSTGISPAEFIQNFEENKSK